MTSVVSVPVLGGLITAFLQVFGWWTKRKVPQVLDDAFKIYAAMNEVVYHTDCDRLIIISLHNCNGPIKADSVLYLTALYESVSGGVAPRINKMDDIRVGGYTIELIQEMMNKSVVWVKTENTEKDSYINTMLAADEMKDSAFFLIQSKADRVIFASAQYREDHKPQAKDMDAIETLRARLIELIK